MEPTSEWSGDLVAPACRARDELAAMEPTSEWSGDPRARVPGAAAAKAAMEPTSERSGDSKDGSHCWRRQMPQWSRPVNGRETGADLQRGVRALAAAMEPTREWTGERRLGGGPGCCV